MARIWDWRRARWALIIVGALNVAFLWGIASGISGYSLSSEIFGFSIQTLLGAANALMIYLAWKIL